MEEYMEEEKVPKIKPPFILKEDVDKEKLKMWILEQEALGNRPASTRKGKISQVAGTGLERVLAISYQDIYVFMFIKDAPEEFLSMKDDELVGKDVFFKAVQKYDEKIIVSHKAIDEFYETACINQKIMSGKIWRILEGKKPYSHIALIRSKGDTIIVPSSEFTYPGIMPLADMVGHIVDFIVIDVKPGKYIGSIRIVSEYRQEQIDFFREIGESFKARVESLGHFGAFLTYKRSIPLVLRNKDFSDNYTLCSDILNPGDTVSVKIKTVTSSGHYVAELTQKYNVEPDFDFATISNEKDYDGEVVKVTAFGVFVHIAPGRDVLCPVGFDQREPMIGDKVVIHITVADSELGRLRGKIMHYNDDLPDLTEFNLVGDNYGY